MKESMTIDDSFLFRWLSLPPNAVSYAVGRDLAGLVAPRVVLELPGKSIDVWAFARAGHCDTQPREGIHSQSGFQWSSRGALHEEQGTSWHKISWQGQALEAVMVCWDTLCGSRMVSHWVIGDGENAVRAFGAALAEFSALRVGKVEVFSGGHWGVDSTAEAAIRSTRAEDLILAEGFRVA